MACSGGSQRAQRTLHRWWGIAAFACAVAAGSLIGVSYLVALPSWGGVLAAVVALLGAGCLTVATVLHARAHGTSVPRTIGRAVAAPFRFVFHLLP